MIAAPLVVLCLLAAEGPPAPKLPIGKDTTYVTGPVTPEGFIDYEAALNNRLGKGITPQTNANVLLWQAFGPTPEGGAAMPPEFFQRLGIKEPPRDGEYFLSLPRYLRDRARLDAAQIKAVHEQRDRAAGRPWLAGDYPHVAAWLQVNDRAIALVVEATRRPDYFNPLVAPRTGKGPEPLLFAPLPSVQRCREAAYALAVRAMLRTAEGKFDEAWQDLLASHRLGRLVARGATLIEALVGISIGGNASYTDLAYLEHTPLTPGQIQDRLKDLQGLPPLPPLADKLDLTERVVFLDLVQLIRRGGVGVLEGLGGGPVKKASAQELEYIASIDWAPALRNINRWYDRMAAALRLKVRTDREKELGRIDEDLKTLKNEANLPALRAKVAPRAGPPSKDIGNSISDILIALFVPAFPKVQRAYDWSEQTQRNLHLAFALAAYHADSGRYPARLDELVPRYLAAVPNDLFSGKALIYQPAAKGYLLYSVGENGRDEGGRSYGDQPPGDDLCVRMPLPESKK
jgi:hypothetical protein